MVGTEPPGALVSQFSGSGRSRSELTVLLRCYTVGEIILTRYGGLRAVSNNADNRRVSRHFEIFLWETTAMAKKPCRIRRFCFDENTLTNVTAQKIEASHVNERKIRYKLLLARRQNCIALFRRSSPVLSLSLCSRCRRRSGDSAEPKALDAS